MLTRHLPPGRPISVSWVTVCCGDTSSKPFSCALCPWVHREQRGASPILQSLPPQGTSVLSLLCLHPLSPQQHLLKNLRGCCQACCHGVSMLCWGSSVPWGRALPGRRMLVIFFQYSGKTSQL